MSDSMTTLLDTADRIVDTSLYPERLRRVIADLTQMLRKENSDLRESREYAAALEKELSDRASKEGAFVAMASSINVDFEAQSEALKKLVHDIGDLIANSEGVAGLHMNGEVAPWESLTGEGSFGAWLGSYDEALALISGAAQ